MSVGQPIQLHTSNVPGIERPQNVPEHNWRLKKRNTEQCKPSKTVAKSVHHKSAP